jgi:hypothetical protein
MPGGGRSEGQTADGLVNLVLVDGQVANGGIDVTLSKGQLGFAQVLSEAAMHAHSECLSHRVCSKGPQPQGKKSILEHPESSPAGDRLIGAVAAEKHEGIGCHCGAGLQVQQPGPESLVLRNYYVTHLWNIYPTRNSDCFTV